ncbi:MAG: flagellar biosynthesis protein FliH [Sphingomonas sp.]|uniref:FliH/SctL family protein n=1 Tax=Sphingomonas sp. TaxID=28214 RepID=UPI0025D5B0AA|nr:FliH/SctL family protein [Sphingomonas sp.]MBX3562956.1 flagellar biosynthesis protein FliH [Sphingomonas sp.]
MSDPARAFMPGLAGHVRVAETVLQRAFGEPASFAASEVEQIGRRRRAGDGPAQPRHFSPVENNGHGQEAHWEDPIAAAHAAGVAEGRAAMLEELDAAQGREAALLDQVSTALSKGAHFDRERMAAHLRQTVLHLVTRMVGEVGIAPDVLAERITAAVDLLADNAESALLRVHYDDVELLKGKLPANVFAVGDPHVQRGGFVIESASTIVEDGPDLWLEQLAAAIDRVPIPPAL